MSTCNRNCGKLCETPDETPQERALWTGIKKLDCNDHAYINGIIQDLERAKRENDIERVLAYGRELERVKILCGNTQDETVQRFERALGMARDVLDLGNCQVIKRSLETRNKPKHMKTMIGLQEIDIIQNVDGSKTLSFPEKPDTKPIIPDPEPIHMAMIRANELARQKKENP